MTSREKYNIYCDMFNHCKTLEDNIRASLTRMNVKIYDIEVYVGKEETEQYQIYVEVSYPVTGYKFHRGLYTENELKKVFRF